MLDLDKFAKGLDLRYAAARYKLNSQPLGPEFKRSNDSLARDYQTVFNEQRLEPQRRNSNDVQLVRVILEEPTIEEQRNIFSDLDKFCETPYLTHLILGHIYESPEDERKILDSIESAMDYSLYVQYLLNAGTIKLNPKSEKLLRTFYRKVNILMFGQMKPSAKGLSSFMHKNVQQQGLFKIDVLRDCLWELKIDYWYVFGVDLLDTLICVVSPGQVSRFQLEPSVRAVLECTGWSRFVETFLEFWASSPLFSGYEMARALISDDSLGNYSPHHWAIDILNERRSPLASWRSVGETYIRILQTWVIEGERELEEKNYFKGIRCLVQIAHLDSHIFRFLNWSLVHKKLPSNCMVFDFRRLYLESQLEKSEPYFPKLAAMRAPGAISATTIKIFDEARLQRMGVQDILKHLKVELPSPAAVELTSKLLSREMISRISSKVPLDRKSGDTNDPLRDHKRIIAVRIALAHEAKVLRLIHPEESDRIQSKEKRQLAVLNLRSEFAKGRVRLPWQRIKFMVSQFLRDKVAPLYKEGILSADTEFSRALLGHYVSNELVQPLLFQGAGSLDYVLGSNLRHGVINTAYMSAFSRALQKAVAHVESGQAAGSKSTKEHSFIWGDVKTTEIMENNFLAYEAARQDILSLLTGFIKWSLTVEEDGRCAKGLSADVSNKIESLARRIDLASDEAVNEVFEVVRSTISYFIGVGREEFKKDIAPKIRERIEAARAECNDQVENAPLFSDELASIIEELNESVPTWVNVIADEDDFDPFSLRDIVSLECEIHHLRELSECAITFSAIIDGKKRQPLEIPNFSGHAFALVNEIVHNLFSNAAKYSGNGKETPMRFMLRLSNEDVTLSVENDVKKNEVKKLVSRLQEAKRLAAAKKPAEAKKDINSGFAKIQSQSLDLLKRFCDISVDFNVRPYRTYNVSVTLPNSRSKLIMEKR